MHFYDHWDYGVCVEEVSGNLGKLFWSLLLKITHASTAFQNLTLNRCRGSV